MPAGVLRLAREYHKIFWPVVSLVSVYMMDDLAIPKRSAQNLLRGRPVFMPTVFLAIRIC